MKIKVGDFIKTLAPATATTEVEVELEENEVFNQETVENIGNQILNDYQWMFDIMSFDGHQTFRLVMNVVYGNQRITVRRFPVYTKNF